MQRKQAKRRALETLKYRWGEAIVVSLLYSIILAALSSVIGVGGLLFGSILLIGYYTILIEASINKKFNIEKIISGLNGDTLSTRIVLSVIKNIYIFLWSLLFIIPGIVKSYAYYLAEFIAMENPEMSASDCLRKSQELMDGHKKELFVLDLSFIGWHILCMFSFGIGYLFLAPYIAQTRIHYIDENIMPLKHLVATNNSTINQ